MKKCPQLQINHVKCNFQCSSTAVAGLRKELDTLQSEVTTIANSVSRILALNSHSVRPCVRGQARHPSLSHLGWLLPFRPHKPNIF